jgi:hypothetical protein
MNMSEGQQFGTRYLISDDGKAITCLLCGKTSHSAEDVAHLFCGFCHAFHHPNVPPALGYSREGDIVTVRLTPGDLDALMVCLGVAAAHGGEGVMDTALRLQELLESEREKNGAEV